MAIDRLVDRSSRSIEISARTLDRANVKLKLYLMRPICHRLATADTARSSQLESY